MDVGTTLRIEPRVQYNGQPLFTWSKDNGPLPSNVQTNGYVLYVPRVTKENEGVYTLTLVDSSGTAKIQVSVIVEQRAPTATQRPGAPRRINIARDMDIELNQGESVNLFCNLRSKVSNPRAITTTSWFRGLRTQREKFPSNIRPNNEVLQVIKAKPSDSGEYTCTVVSSDGVLSSAVAYIRVKRKYLVQNVTGEQRFEITASFF